MAWSRRSWDTASIHDYIKTNHPRVVIPSGEIISVTQKVTWGCSVCGGAWCTDFHHLRRRSIACPHCSLRSSAAKQREVWAGLPSEGRAALNIAGTLSTRLTVDKIKKRLPTGVELVSATYVNIKIPLEWRCTSCQHTWSAPWPSVIYHGRLCSQCNPYHILPLTTMIKRLKDRTDLSYSANYSGYMEPCEWLCSYCSHTWTARPTDVIRRNQGCPMCFPQYRRERQLGAALKHQFQVLPQYRIPCPPEIRKSKVVRVDYYLPETACVVEHHGIQHFQFHPFFHRNSLVVFRAQQARDEWVRDYCEANNITYVVVRQNENIEAKIAGLVGNVCRVA